MHKYTPTLEDILTRDPSYAHRRKADQGYQLGDPSPSNFNSTVAIKRKQSKNAKGCHRGSKELISKTTLKQ